MINTEKIEYMSLNQSSINKIRSASGEYIKRLTHFKYLGSYVFPTKNIDVILAKICTSLNSMNTIWRSNLNIKLKINVFHAIVESILIADLDDLETNEDL